MPKRTRFRDDTAATYWPGAAPDRQPRRLASKFPTAARARRRGDRVSNCDFMTAKSLIDLPTSRLALRAPALRAATALTRPNQSAQRLPRGRHAVPTAMTVGPKH